MTYDQFRTLFSWDKKLFKGIKIEFGKFNTTYLFRVKSYLPYSHDDPYDITEYTAVNSEAKWLLSLCPSSEGVLYDQLLAGLNAATPDEVTKVLEEISDRDWYIWDNEVCVHSTLRENWSHYKEILK